MIVLLATSLALLAVCDGFSYSECDHGPNPILHLDSAYINPSDVHIPGGLTPTVQLTILRPITGHMKLDVSLKKHVLFDIPIPCVSHVGSCSYDFCDLVSAMKDANGTVQCPLELQQSNFPCTCPCQPGTYLLRGETFHIPHVSGVWSWLAKGDYKVQAKLTDTATNEVVACYGMHVSIIDDGCSGIRCIFGKK